ncbi:MAG: polysaccharide deacetylase family protein [Calditrichaeota bacterium]|nr:MAG: polysaccharide deacetylase family protein [Calditrichota bacterium]
MERIREFFDNVTLQSVLSDLSHVIALERLGPRISERVFWRAPIQDRRVALTFDDGPHPTYTPQLLTLLAKYEVPATFFLIGRHIARDPGLAREVAAGHEVGNHTFTHPPLFRLSDDAMREEILRTDELLRSLDGVVPRFLRPPMGLFSRRVLDVVEAAGYKTVVGDVYPRDPHQPGRKRIVSRVLRRVTRGSIIILHDGGNTSHVDRSQTVWAVGRLIPELLQRGFEFVTLSALLAAHLAESSEQDQD